MALHGRALPPAPESVEFDFPLVSERSREDLEAYGLNMVEDYHDFKKEVLSWLATYGKNPEKGEGLAESTLQSTHYKLEIVFRWLWEDEDAYTTALTPDHADRSSASSIAQTRWRLQRASLRESCTTAIQVPEPDPRNRLRLGAETRTESGDR